MEDLSKYTPTELLKMINDIKQKHDNLRQLIIDNTYVLDELQNKINNDLVELNELEKNYVALIEEMEKR